MRFLFVGGGTGGHLTPAIGLAEGLEKEGHETMFLLSGRAVEQAYFADGRPCSSLGFDTSRLPKALALVGAMRHARHFARDYQPDAVIALGGAASAAALGIGRRRHCPLVLLEGNYVIGRSVKLMEAFATSTLTMFQDTANKCRRGHAMGPVSRQLLDPVPAAEARTALGLEAHRCTLLVMGGSQGARDVNLVARDLLPDLKRLGWQLLALVGNGKTAELEGALQEAQVPGKILEHCTQMGMAYSAADFALTRGGASSMGEVWMHSLPSAVFPYPYHKDRQQEWNARALEPGVICINDIDPQALSAIRNCLEDSDKRAQMAAALAESAPADGRAEGARVLAEIAARKP
ncbi:MAG: UDP-N-acetylglucosamine--N-acetylmuramyl-(pentapeptide) pyrophosphoryl-undecaprenol N-acetylglucosamine transferase [Planctomycetes bacterium]|nr:UDP-N-acetylglucosamine--N-acetylmuramyl-(pentapeptide) pyrophosphoryl-undecaprenol N-acetylglucosamine transferase [Planctomycetota bacterium]